MQRDARWPVVVAGALTFGSGALDVLALTKLGGVFASVMTGNLALLGLGLARADAAGIVPVVVAVVAYAVGVGVGTRIAGVHQPDQDVWPPRVTATLTLQLGVLCALAFGWSATHASPAGVVRLVLLSAAAVSMGLQSAAVRGLGVPLATTFLTGTLTALLAALASGTRLRGHATGVTALIAAVTGAVCGGLALRITPAVTPLLSVGPLLAVIVGAVIVGAVRHRRHHQSAAAPSTSTQGER